MNTMARLAHCIVLVPLFIVLLSPALALGAVQALFGLETPAEGPFPTDWFTAQDASHNTGRRVNLPLPNCGARPSDCDDLRVINTLDGFNLQPRLSVPFDGAIDPATATSQTIFLINLGSTLRGHDREGRVVGINQVLWDPPSNTLHGESDELLDQHTLYALIVTRGVRDAFGAPVQATEAFRRFRQTVRGEYKQALLDAIQAARRVGVREDDIAVASVFTTQSTTAVMEKMRDQLKAATPAPADFLLGRGGMRTVFPLIAVAGITFTQHRRTEPPMMFQDVPVAVATLGIIPGAVGQIAFGKYLSPDYETADQFIPPVGTRTGLPAVQRMNEIHFNLFLPAGPTPAGGWPVAIFGHGLTDNKNNSPFAVGAIMAAHGIATVAINAVGHGFGPLGTLTVQTTGGPVTFSAGSRGFDQDGNKTIDSNEGVNAAPPRQIIRGRDGLRQTVVDLMQLVRVIEVGMDVDGDGFQDLDPSRIYYFGWSLGANYGTKFLALEPSVRAGVLNVPGGAAAEVARLSPVFRPSIGLSLATRMPPLLNPPGLMQIGGVPVGPPHFNENLPLRTQPPVINTVAGAIPIQEVLENREWVSQSGNPVAYAPHIRRDPLADVPPKSVIYQFARGDRTVPNPTTTAILRAGELADRATFLRNDLVVAERPAAPKDPHGFLIRINSPVVGDIALDAQQQIAVFFASDGTVVIHPEPRRFFEVPLPEDLGYIP